MDTPFFIATTFFFIGLIVGAIAVVIVGYKLSDDDEIDVYDEKLDKEPEWVQTPFGRIDKSSIIKVSGPINMDTEMTEEIAEKISHQMVSLEKYKHDLDQKLTESLNEQDFTKVYRLQQHLADADEWHYKRNEFFVDAIGKKIIANKANCECEVCNESLLVGIDIETAQMAFHCFLVEIESNLECDNVEYRYV
jgi:hypothetical protein